MSRRLNPVFLLGTLFLLGTIGVALAGIVLMITTYWFGRPQRLIPPIARGIPRWAPRPHVEP